MLVELRIVSKAMELDVMTGHRVEISSMHDEPDHRRDHISPVLRQRHWLPVRQRVQFKLAVLVFKALQAPQCLTDDCQLVAAAGRRQLRSSDAVNV